MTRLDIDNIYKEESDNKNCYIIDFRAILFLHIPYMYNFERITYKNQMTTLYSIPHYKPMTAIDDNFDFLIYVIGYTYIYSHHVCLIVS